MLIGVQLPITNENVLNINAHQLMQAHDEFLMRAQLDQRNHRISTDDSNEEQYLICRSEIRRRLMEHDQQRKTPG